MFVSPNVVWAGIPVASAFRVVLPPARGAAARVHFTGPEKGDFQWIVVENGSLVQAAQRRFKASTGIPIKYSGDLESLFLGNKDSASPQDQIFTERQAISFIRRHGGRNALAIFPRSQFRDLFELVEKIGLELADPVQYGFSVGLGDKASDSLDALRTDDTRMHLPPYLLPTIVHGHYQHYSPRSPAFSSNPTLLEGAKMFVAGLVRDFDPVPDYPEYQFSKEQLERAKRLFHREPPPGLEEYLSLSRDLMSSLFRIVPFDPENDPEDEAFSQGLAPLHSPPPRQEPRYYYSPVQGRYVEDIDDGDSSDWAD